MVEPEQEAGVESGNLQQGDNITLPFSEAGACLGVNAYDAELLQIADRLIGLLSRENSDDSPPKHLYLHLSDFLFGDFRMCECLYHACSSSSIGCISSSPLKRTACSARRALSNRPPQ